MKVRNQHVYATPERIKQLHEECEWIGRNVSRIDPKNHGHLIIYALPPKKRTRKVVENLDKRKGVSEDSENKVVRNLRPRRGNGYNRYKDIDDQA